MRNFSKIALLVLAALALTVPVHAQTPNLVQTKLAVALDSQARTFPVASVSGLVAGNYILIDNETMPIYSVSSVGNLVTVAPRGATGTSAVPHKVGTMVLSGPSQAFIAYDPSGACSNGSGLFQYSPIINTRTGNQWLCSSVTGKVVPGYGNLSAPPGVTAAVASAAGLITPSGPVFHVTGTAAITGLNLPVGFDPSDSQTITIIADAVFSWTAATNIAAASSTLTGGLVVVGKAYTLIYDPATQKFYVLGA
jgi:hypothetical protein